VLWKGGDMDGHGDGVGIFEDGGGIIRYDKEVVWVVAMSDDVAWLRLIRVVLMLCKIMDGYLDGTSEHEEWFEGGRRSVYKQRLFGVGGFPFLLSLLVLLYSRASTTLTQPWFLSCRDSLDTNFEASYSDYNITSLLPISPSSDPACYNICQLVTI